MTNKKSTKRALLVSAMAMVICFTMLLGTTFAWFTSSDENTGNVIAAGTLKVGITYETTTGTYVDATEGEMIDFDNFEPGYVLVQNFKVNNEGSLAFNYKLKLVAAGAVATKEEEGIIYKLTDVIDVYYYLNTGAPTRGDLTADDTDPAYLGTLTEVLATDFAFCEDSLTVSEGSDVITLVLMMKGEEAGNVYQDMELGTTFAVQVLATQMASETDDLGDNTYDEGQNP